MRKLSQIRRNNSRAKVGAAGPSRGANLPARKQAQEAGFEKHAVGLVAGKKSCAALTKERNATRHTNVVARGQRFSVSSTDAAIPIQQTVSSARSLVENQSSVGANQKRKPPPNTARHFFR